ncbi:hypothetical protein G7054_g11459 [Neopestalotiopsis clavispora]|nr:hypothetical protein G7054_g11459 [Neopestalotiopsis clavispora]
MGPARARSRVASEGSVRLPNPTHLSSKLVAEYHNTLREQNRLPGADQRSLAAATDTSRDTEASSAVTSTTTAATVATTATATTASTRRWIPARPKTSDCNAKPPRKYSGKRDNSSSSSNILSPPLQQLSREEIEEFETLPLAVRRKYGYGEWHPIEPDLRAFGTLEQHQLDQLGRIRSDQQDDLDDLGHCQPDPYASSGVACALPCSTCIAVVLSPCAGLHSYGTALHEAIYKIGRRSDRRPPPSHSAYASTFTSSKPSTAPQSGRMVDHTSAPKQGLERGDSFYDSFRWLEGDDDLDLSLQLDDYHANLKESVPRRSTNEHRPSFRRHLSINKIPFGRSSMSISRPGTNSGTHTPASPSTSSPTSQPPLPVRRRSRTLSLINPRPVFEEPIPTFDPDAAHYQDPEARAKLRVYLASPQKFDEAVEFGFPSKNAITNLPDHERHGSRGHSRGLRSQDSSRQKTFFSDDQSSIYSEESLPDPESPRTPNSPDKADSQQESLMNAMEPPFRPPMDGYAQIPASSREMTLRMTLTRPDLRAGDDEIYGWQKKSAQQMARAAPRLEDAPPKKSSAGNTGKSKESLEAFFASLDEEEEAAAAAAASASADTGVVKRFWNKVRRN